MLILTRKSDESLMIGDDIEVTISQINGDQVKVGIKAPQHIKVYRKEIYAAIQEENKKAGQVQLENLQLILQKISGR